MRLPRPGREKSKHRRQGTPKYKLPATCPTPLSAINADRI